MIPNKIYYKPGSKFLMLIAFSDAKRPVFRIINLDNISAIEYDPKYFNESDENGMLRMYVDKQTYNMTGNAAKTVFDICCEYSDYESEVRNLD